MKTQMSLLLVLSWISVAVVHAAQAPTGDVSARVFNSADVTVPNMNPGEWTTLTFNSERWDTANLHQFGPAKSICGGQILHLCQHHMGKPHSQRALGTASTTQRENSHR